MERPERLLIPLLASLPLAGVGCLDTSSDGDDDAGRADVGGGGADSGGSDTGSSDTGGGDDVGGDDDAAGDTSGNDDTTDDVTAPIELGDLEDEVTAFNETYCENSATCYEEYFGEYYDSVEQCVTERTASFGGFVANETNGSAECIDGLEVLFDCTNDVWLEQTCDSYLPDEYCEDEYATAADACEFTEACEDGSEISWRQECDGTPDCPGGEDEAYCEDGSGDGYYGY